jgi:hypothetical protein
MEHTILSIGQKTVDEIKLRFCPSNRRLKGVKNANENRRFSVIKSEKQKQSRIDNFYVFDKFLCLNN